MLQRSSATTEAAVRRHHALDGLRGLSALAVANYHFLHHRLEFTIQSMGTFTVYLFFTLSAVTMLMVYGERFRDGIERRQLLGFYAARAARIMPLLALVSLALAALAHFEADAVWLSFLTGTGLFAIAGPGFFSAGAGAWSLGIELAFYAVFPMLAATAGRWRTATLLGLLVALLIAQRVYIAGLSGLDPLLFWGHYTVPLTFAPFFAIGFLIHRADRRPSRGHALAAIITLLGISLWSLAWAGDLLTNTPVYLLLTAAAGLCVYFAWQADIPRMAQPVASFFGEVSYSLYLTHWFAFVVVNRLSQRLGIPAAIEWPLFLAAAIIGAWLSYRLFENPLRRWLRPRT